MTIDLPGYTISEKIYEGANTIVYRARRDGDERRAILKLLKAEYPTPEDLAKFQHEYQIATRFDSPGIVKAYALENFDDRQVALVLEDFGGVSLREYLNSFRLKLSDFLRMAIALTDILGELHHHNIIHRDIHPLNIIIHPKTQEVKITDFSISLSENREEVNAIEGTLPYMSPEQTGRMNAGVDRRCDFYSLGITFYEMLAGELPFKTSDPMEIVHCHIAKTPRYLSDVNSDIPPALSDIVMKLLAKTPQERYQSAYGIKADLEQCWHQLRVRGEIASFPLAQQDLSGELVIPNKLYGREQEVAILLETYWRVSGASASGGRSRDRQVKSLDGKSEIVLVRGYSGVGKSALIDAVHQPIVRQGGYFIRGKFERYKHNTPYVGLIEAFQELMRQLLSESEEDINRWQNKILSQIGKNGQVIIDVIPEVELIIGEQPSVPSLPPLEAQNRFNLVFQQFLSVFTTAEHPLVLFLDDLHWADSASLKLLHYILTASESQYLLLIGAYRENEVETDRRGNEHPLLQTIEAIAASGVRVTPLELQPLNTPALNQLLGETLSCPPTRSQPLAELIYRKTQGNPFFIRMLLNSLTQDKLLACNLSAGRWEWDLAEIEKLDITDNVVDLMVRKIQQLSENGQTVLQFAACIGNFFFLDLLALVCEKSLSATAADLKEAVEQGLIVPLENTYKIPLLFGSTEPVALPVDNLVVAYRFLHDRVHQAAYSMIHDDRTEQVHLKVGKLILKHTNPEEREEKIFDIVHHLNLGANWIRSQSEKYRLARLNLMAGEKAKAAMAYENAVKYLTQGLELLAADSWQTQYDLTLNLYVEIVEAEYLNRNYRRASALGKVALENARTLLEKIAIYEKKIESYVSQNQMRKAIDTGWVVLNMLGITLPKKPNQLHVLWQLIHTKWAIAGKAMEDLAALPEMSDRDRLAAMRILAAMTPAAYVASPAMLHVVVFTMVQLSVKYGNSPLSAFAYAFYGVLLYGTWSDIKGGDRSGQLALRLVERLEANSIKAKVSDLVYAHIKHAKLHIRDTIEPLSQSIQIGLDTGDLEWAGHSALHYCSHNLFSGEPLESVVEKYEQYIAWMVKIKLEFHIQYAKIWEQFTFNLREDAEAPWVLSGNSFDEEAMLPSLVDSTNTMSLFAVYLAKSMLAYLFGERERAVFYAKRAENYKLGVVGLLSATEHNFYQSLALLANLRDQPLYRKIQSLMRVTLNQRKMKRWATHAAANYQHKYDLIEAEKARILGKTVKAMGYYDRAIKAARKQGYLQVAAIASECAAEFYLQLGREKIAATYMTEAYYTYVRWGATRKVKELDTQYPQLISRGSGDDKPSVMRTTTISTTTGSHAGLLDLTAFVKASQAINGEIVLDNLLQKLMTIVMENAGAQKCYLILETEGKFYIESTATADESQVTIAEHLAVERCDRLPVSVINYVARTQESVVLKDASAEERFPTDTYIIQHQPKSILCTPILHQGKLIGLLYLENNLIAGAFTPDRLEVLKLLSSQAAISIENARLYTNLLGFSQELEEKNRALEQLDRLKDEFLANTSHELRTPLNGIIGIAESMLEGATGELSEFQRSNLSLVVASGRSLTQLVNDLLDFSKLKHKNIQLDVKPVGMREIADVVLTICQPLIGNKSLQLINAIATDLPPVEADENRLQQILHNLVGNAIKYTDSGRVEVSAEIIREHKGVAIAESDSPENSPSPDGYLAISVRDTGIGIEDEKLNRIFVSFEQVDGSNARQYSGVGLGLAITKQLVELHGGKIWVESKVNEGSKFTFTLPLSANATENKPRQLVAPSVPLPQKSATPPVPVPQPTETAPREESPIPQFKPMRNRGNGEFEILIVDDEPINLQVLVNHLSLENYSITTASNGIEALEAIENGLRPDIILLDVMMPRMTGYEVCQKIRETFPANELPVVLLTARNQTTDMMEAFGAGANDYLTKPISKNELLARIKMHIQLSKINLAYARFVPREFLQFLGYESIIDVQLGDQVQKDMTILFSDIRSFTSLSERLSPRENFNFINSYLSRVGPVIRNYNGFVDKYIGDAVMALFPNRAEDALQAALDMQKQVTIYNVHRQKSGYMPIAIGIGLHTGSLMLGTIGEEQRMETTVISDAVNLASRMEGLTKLYGASIAISGQTLIHLDDPTKYNYRFLGKVQVKGKKESVAVFEVLDCYPPHLVEIKLDTRTKFERGIMLYQGEKFAEAHQLFKKVLEQNPQDQAARFYIDRCEYFLKHNISQVWEVLDTLNEKM